MVRDIVAENAGWDRAPLALELQELSIEIDLDVTITGFETGEIDLLIDELNQAPPSERSKIAKSLTDEELAESSLALLIGDNETQGC